MKQGLLSILIFTGIWGALWDTPEADLSLARLHITSPAGAIQNRPGFLVNVSGITSLTSLYLEDTASERTSSLPIIKGYPEAQVSLRFGRFELGLSGEQTLDAGGKIWKRDSLGISMSLDIYRLSLEAAWWPKQGNGLVLGYNHYLARFILDEVYPLDSIHYRAFGHTPGVSAAFVSTPTKDITLDALVSFAPYILFYTAADGVRKRDGYLIFPLTFIGDIYISPTEQFEFFFTLRYTFNSMARNLHITSYIDSIPPPSDTIDEHMIPFYDKKTLSTTAGASYRIIEPLSVRLWGEYSASPVDSLYKPWPNPGGISVAAEAIWKQGAWRFAAEIGTRRFHPIFSEADERLEGTSYHLRIGLGLAI